VFQPPPKQRPSPRSLYVASSWLIWIKINSLCYLGANFGLLSAHSGYAPSDRNFVSAPPLSCSRVVAPAAAASDERGTRRNQPQIIHPGGAETFLSKAARIISLRGFSPAFFKPLQSVRIGTESLYQRSRLLDVAFKYRLPLSDCVGSLAPSG
jgi:hypothetical protein